jgi:hypothetical protein
MDEIQPFNSKSDILNIICADSPLCSVSVWWSYFLSILFNYISTYSYVNVGLLSQIQSVPRNYLAMLLNRLITIFRYIVSAETILFWLWPYALWPLISVHKCVETIQGRIPYEERQYFAKLRTTIFRNILVAYRSLSIPFFSYLIKLNRIWRQQITCKKPKCKNFVYRVRHKSLNDF